MGVIPKKEICPVCGRPIRGDVRIKIKDNIELCKTCSSEIEMDSAMIPNMTVDDIKAHLEYRKQNREKMEQFKMSWCADAGAYILRADTNMRLWYCTNERGDRNPPLFAFSDLKSAVYLENGEPAEELQTGLKSLFGERTAPTLVQSMKIIIDVDNYYIHQIVIETIPTGTGMTTGTMQYKKNRKDIQDMMVCLENIQRYALTPEVEDIPEDELEQISEAEQAQIPEASAAAEPAEATCAAPEAESDEETNVVPETGPAEEAYTAPESGSEEEVYTAPETGSAEASDAEPAEEADIAPEDDQEAKRGRRFGRNRKDE